MAKEQIKKRLDELKDTPLVPAGPEEVQVGDKKVTLTGNLPEYKAPEQIYGTINDPRLTRFERWVVQLLPKVMDSPLVQGASWFATETPAKFILKPLGAALSYLDIGAEGVERVTGFIAQYNHVKDDPVALKDFNDQIASAWYAGSLWADMVNFTPMSENGFMTFPTDLPGVDGLVSARQEIFDLQANGVSYHDALVQVREKYYNEAGALGIRGQLQDTFMHVVADPINLILPELKVPERLAAFKIAIGGKVFPDEAVKTAARLEGITAQVADLEKAVLVAEDIGDLETAAIAADKLGELRKDLDYIADLHKFAIENKLGPVEERIVSMMKILPDVGDAAKNKGLVRRVIGLFTLTDEARAHEFINTVVQNLQHTLFNGGDPESWVRAIQRAADGQRVPELGHMLLTVEGRAVGAVLDKSAISATQLLNTFQITERFEGPLFRSIAATLGETPANLLRRLDDDAVAVATQYARKIQEAGPDATRLVEGLFKGQNLALDDAGLATAMERLKIFNQFGAYDDAMFAGELYMRLADDAAQLAIARWGLKAKGGAFQFADAIKSAESLAFLKANPGYPLRNKFNNVATGIARGAYGNPLDDVEKLWVRVGFEPPRLRSGVGMMGEFGTDVAIRQGAGKALEYGSQILRDTEFPADGFLGKITKWFQSKKGLGTGELAQKFESEASIRATTVGYQRHWKQINKVGKGIKPMNAGLVSEIGADNASVIERAIESAWSHAELDDIFFSKNLNLNMETVLDDAFRNSGLPFDSILGQDFVQHIETRLVAAMNQGPTEVRAAMKEIRGLVQDQINSLDDITRDVIRNQTASLVSVEGPGALPKVYSNMTDSLWGVQSRHAMDMASLNDKLLDLPVEMRGAFWDRLFQENDAFYGRHWARMDSHIEGASKGLDDVIEQMRIGGTLTPEIEDGLRAVQLEMRGTLDDWSGGWKDFFDYKTERFKELKRLRSDESFAKKLEEITTDLDARYNGMSISEDIFMGRMDEIVTRGLPDVQREVYLRMRGRINATRGDLRQSVLDFRDAVRPLPANQRAKLWQEQFWPDYTSKSQQLSQLERASKAALSGDPRAQAIFDVVLQGGPVDAQTAPFLSDFHSIVPEEMLMGQGLDELWFTRSADALTSIENSALDVIKRPPLKLGDVLSPSAQTNLRKYISEVKRDFSRNQYTAARMGEWTRDAALLNYNRRIGLDSYLSLVYPYEFWTVHSIGAWMWHSLQRPAMLGTYLKMKRFFDNAWRPEGGMPSRLKGYIKIPLPFLPDYLGDGIYINPLKTALPFDNWLMPFEQIHAQEQSDIGKAERVLQELLNDGRITDADYQQAVQSRSGPVWERAVVLAQQDDTEGRMNGLDVMNTLLSPHAPLVWALNVARGTPEDIQPFLPITRGIKGLTGLLGLPAGGINPEAPLRTALGLPAFDKWDDYRIDRQLSNMAATGEITVDEALQAMLNRQGPIFNKAKLYAGREFGISVLGSLTGIPMGAYPEGEEIQRDLRLKYEEAWTKYEAGNPNAVNEFNDKYPEYEARLALFDKPEERLRSFLVDNLWDVWNNSPKVHKDEIKAQLGDDFQYYFLQKDTRNTEIIPMATLQQWVTLAGGDVPGQVEGLPTPLTNPDVAYRVQVFYDTREQVFRYNDMLYPIMQEYYDKPTTAQRNAFKAKHPIIQQYWNWRRDFMRRNPTLAPYLSDSPPAFDEAPSQPATPNFTPYEWQAYLGDNLYRLILDDAPLPPAAIEKLQRLGLTPEVLQGIR